MYRLGCIQNHPGTKACATVAAADCIGLDDNIMMHCFMWPLSSCCIKISVVSHVGQ